ncbi:alpha/beta hydrolase [Bacillus testis]|uniref:alpha/beta hydrolase n=1 Tax=Bacillus testis TaxID=1622072 RepID=UPI00067EE617|nr:alpha/beta hydrolase [Bacillus testis]
MKKLISILLILAVVIVIALAGVSSYFYQVAVERGPKPFLETSEDMEKTTDDSLHADAQKWLAKQPVQTISIKSNDGFKLKGYYLPAKGTSDKTVILAHGYAGQAKDMARFAKMYHEEWKYNVLMPDARGHGESEGNYIGFGWHERKDYLRWIQTVLNMNGNSTQIVLHGVSMGGATVLMTSGEQLPQQVKAIIDDCGYTSAEDVLTYQLKQLYNLPRFPIVPSTSLYTKIKDGYSFSEASALKQVEKAKLPILFIHGDEDTFVPVEMVHRLYKQAKVEKKLYIVPGAQHGNAYDVDPGKYQDEVEGFLSNYIK